jgi:hypothetical protein
MLMGGQLTLPVCAHILRRCATDGIVTLRLVSLSCAPFSARSINDVDYRHAAMRVAV